MTRRGAIAMLTGGAALLVTGCRALFGTTTLLRYRITVICDTPDGTKIASAVQEIMRHDPVDAITPIRIGTTKVLGDAVLIVVGNKHYFVGLNQCKSLLIDAIRSGDVHPQSARVNGNIAEILSGFKNYNAHAIISGETYLRLPSRSFSVEMFLNESDYTTIETVRSADACVLKTVTIDVTNDAITRQTERVLPWLRTLSRAEVSKSPSPDNFLSIRLEDLSDEFGAGQ